MNYDEYEFKTVEYLKYVLISILYIFIFVYVFYRSPIILFIFLPLSFIYPILKKKDLIKQRKQKFLLEFKEALLILSAFVSAGYSIENAIKESMAELILLFGANSYIVKELGIINKKIMLNKSVESAFLDLSSRVKLDEVENFAIIIKIAKRSGGRLMNIFEESVKVISDKINIKEEIITLISSKIFEQKLMNFFPLAMILYIDFTSSNYFKLMYTSFIGRIIMTLSLAFYIFSIYLSNKIMDIRV